MARKVYDFPLFKLEELAKEKNLKLYKSAFKEESQYKAYIEFKKRQKIIEQENIRKLREDLKKYEVKAKEKVKEKPKCNFNYETKNNIGYLKEKRSEIYINDETTDYEHIENQKEILSIIKNYDMFRCPQRQNYIRLNYRILFEGSQNEESSIATHISLSLQKLKEETIKIYNDLVELVQRGGSPSAILVYQIDYVNYDFKSYIRESNL